MKKIASTIILSLFSIQTIATWIPAEPMTIYWNINWKSLPDTAILEISNNWKILNSSKIISNKYWTNKTFDLKNKINLEKFDWQLKFSVKEWNKKIEIWKIELWEIKICNENPIFQKSFLCQYNLLLKNVNLNLEEIEKEKERLRKLEEERLKKLEEEKKLVEEKKLEEEKKILIEKEKKLNKNFWKLNIKEKLPLNIWREKFLVKKEKLNKKINFSTKEVIVSGEKVEIKDELQRDLLIISKIWQKELFLHIPKKARLLQKNIEINPPKLIEFKQIEKRLKNKKIKKIIWAVEIPTSRKLNFSDKIEICIPTEKKSIKNLQVFYSQDLISWNFDSNASDLKIVDSKMCFKTNHLTWFVIWEVESNWFWNARWIDVCPQNIDNSWSRYDGKCDKIYLTLSPTSSLSDVDEVVVKEEKIVKKEDSISEMLWELFWDDDMEIPVKTNTFIEPKTNNVAKKDYSISAKTYSTFLKWAKLKEITTKISWFNVIILTWEKEYNLNTLQKVKEINSNYKRLYYKTLLIEYLNSITNSYSLYKEALANNDWVAWFSKTYNLKISSFKIKQNIFRNLDSWKRKANNISF